MHGCPYGGRREGAGGEWDWHIYYQYHVQNQSWAARELYSAPQWPEWEGQREGMSHTQLTHCAVHQPSSAGKQL